MRDPVLLDAPARLPGTCICGGAGPVIDTMLEIDGYGRVYVCLATCAVQVATIAGWSSPASVVELEGLVESQQAHIRTVEAQLEQAGQDVDRLAEGIGAKVIDFVSEREKRRPPVETVA